MSGQLVAPRVPEAAERLEMSTLVDTCAVSAAASRRLHELDDDLDHWGIDPSANTATSRVMIEMAQHRRHALIEEFPASTCPTTAAILRCSYGKTVHTWQYDRGDELPLGARTP